jgi:hypothetical protein
MTAGFCCDFFCTADFAQSQAALLDWCARPSRLIASIAPRPVVYGKRPGTKCGQVWDEHREIGRRLKADSIRGECEASLRRLKVETIDLYQIHWPDPDEEIEEGWATLPPSRRRARSATSAFLTSAWSR